MQINPRHFYEPAPKADQVGNEQTRLTEDTKAWAQKIFREKYPVKLDPKEQEDKGLWA